MARRLSGASILLVEDNEINQQVATEILEGAGLVVTDCRRRRPGRGKLCAPRTFAAVLMDLQMPVMDGFQATREIRKEARLRDLPILAMTASAMTRDREAALEAGMNDHVTKPIDVGRLYSALLQWVKPPADRDRAPARTADAATGETDPLPDLDGIDVGGGLRRVGGNRVLYTKLLRRFSDTYRDTATDIRDGMAKGDLTTVRQLAHTVKGVAGNIGADPLQAAAGLLEEAAAAGRTEGADDLVDRFAEQLQRVLVALDGWAPDAPPPGRNERRGNRGPIGGDRRAGGAPGAAGAQP